MSEHTPEWRLDEIRAECADHTDSGAHDLSPERARLIIELVDDRKALLAACEHLMQAFEQVSSVAPAGLADVILFECRAAIAKARGGK